VFVTIDTTMKALAQSLRTTQSYMCRFFRESAYRTPAQTPNSKSLTRLQKPRTTARVTEKSHRHFWHVNQGEVESTGGAKSQIRAMRSPAISTSAKSCTVCCAAPVPIIAVYWMSTSLGSLVG
jgi:hypothetical protein